MGERTVESIDEVFTKKERALAGVTGYELLPYFVIALCTLMAVLFGVQKKIVEGRKA